MEQIVVISNGQANQLRNNKWDLVTFFNPDTEDFFGNTYVSTEERDTLLPQYQWLKSRPVIEYVPKEIVI